MGVHDHIAAMQTAMNAGTPPKADKAKSKAKAKGKAKAKAKAKAKSKTKTDAKTDAKTNAAKAKAATKAATTASAKGGGKHKKKDVPGWPMPKRLKAYPAGCTKCRASPGCTFSCFKYRGEL